MSKLTTKFETHETNVKTLTGSLEKKLETIEKRLVFQGDYVNKLLKHTGLEKEDIPDLVDDTDRQTKTKGYIHKNFATVTINSDDEDKNEDVQEQQWIEERRLKSNTNPYGNLPEYKLKADVPNFNGGLHIEDLLDWLYEVESFFIFMEVPDSSKVKLVAYKLKGGAAAWWETLCDNRRKYHKPPIRTWKRMLDLLRAKFLPQDYKQQLFLKLQNCRQGARLVKEYVAELYALIARNRLNETEEHLVACIIDGLNNLIQQGMTQYVFTMVEAIQQAIKIERRVLNSSRQTTPRKARYQHFYKAARPSNSYYGNQGERGSTMVVDPQEFSFGSQQQPQHQPKPTSVGFSNRMQNQFPPPNKPTNIYSKFRGDKCNQPGHSSSDCRRFNGFIGDNQVHTESKDVKVFDDDEGDEDENIELHKTYGEHFVGMIRTLMLTEPCYSQRHNIFKTKCFIGGKFCDMIIDSGSVDNYIASVVVEKMGLPTTPHPTPYFVGWVNSSSTQRITHQCVIKFSFVGYEESVLCDVIDMTATHLLLGRPWQYDVRAVHNYFDNTYTFYKDVKE
ncbi:uncharacterized protein LOC113294699 [Papaver somniferum]|uniref:uncharacterized protein LOC113294699 n=1 Tax=Papaver somniferum TaxID=3469 RepID=UPI000E70069B|nr:uncharacterized protein LOC113294699 [Papaver somniferum]